MAAGCELHGTRAPVGHDQNLPIADLVPGDVVRLNAGDLVPADARLLNERPQHLAKLPRHPDVDPEDRADEP